MPVGTTAAAPSAPPTPPRRAPLLRKPTDSGRADTHQCRDLGLRVLAAVDERAAPSALPRRPVARHFFANRLIVEGLTPINAAISACVCSPILLVGGTTRVADQHTLTVS
ncbi:hypothetical protein QWU44_11495 [Corynebacterium sp. CCM 9203]